MPSWYFYSYRYAIGAQLQSFSQLVSGACIHVYYDDDDDDDDATRTESNEHGVHMNEQK